MRFHRTIEIGRQRQPGDPGLGWNGIRLKREEAVIVGAGARHLIWHRVGGRGRGWCVHHFPSGDSESSPLSLDPPLEPHANSVAERGGPLGGSVEVAS